MLGVKTGRERGNLGTHSKARETLEEEEIGNACKEAIVFSVFHAIRSGVSRPSDEGGPGHPDPEIGGGGGQKKFFRTSVWSRNKGGGGGPRAPLLPWIRHLSDRENSVN